MSVCVVGAGPCGLTTLKNLKQAGIQDIVCFEAGSQIGGLWIFDEEPGHSSVYETTHTISSKRLSQFEDFPMPKDYPDFPSHVQILKYFQSYAENFDLHGYIQFHSKVTRVERQGDGRWQVDVTTPDGDEQQTYDYLFICSGHHWHPLQPDLPGDFSGTQIHAHDYKTVEPYRGKRVMVVGAGNTGCDIAADLSRVASRSVLSMRRGCYIVPKIVFGMPVDVAYKKALWLPKPLRQRLLGWLLRLLVGRWEKYGLQKPDCRPLEMHPSLNSEVLYLLRHGTIHPRRGIVSAEGNTVTFDGGETEEIDAIIWATGYTHRFPFFDDLFGDLATASKIPLYLKMMPADHDNLFFIGLFQPIGCLWNLADYQAKIAALQIAGRLNRPTDLPQRIQHEMDNPHWQFESGQRHAHEVDYHQFKGELLNELKSAA
jgi:cation diffusion facilitator CzcD-associated flavoprotein CzcO